MNPENNNVGNGLESQSFGQFNPVSTPDVSPEITPSVPDANAQVESQTFAPFENLNNETLNVPTENTFNPTPVDPSTFNAEISSMEAAPVPEAVTPSFAEPAVESVQPVESFEAPVMQEPIAPDVQPAMDFSQPVENPQPAQTFDQVEPVAPDFSMDNQINQNPVSFEQPQAEPVFGFNNADTLNDTPQVDSLGVEPAVSPVNGVPVEPTVATPQPEGPTIPIPDSMPTTDYQATVSTPLDYATPMSDFDQIGSTPELDPKAKAKNKNSKKTLLFCLIIILIAALGAGSYYLINVKGFFNSSSVVTKNLTIGSGETLPTSIDEYATFKNTSSSNCVLSTANVDTTKAGTYKYTITCGDSKYEGNITVTDKTAPNVELNLAYTTVQSPILKQTIVRSIDEENATYDFTNETEANEAFATAGLKTVSITAKDASENSVEVIAPVVVLDTDMHFGIVGIKNTEQENVKEKLELFLTGDIVCKVGFKSYVITFNSEDEYNDAIKSYTGGAEFTYGDYTGIPLFYKSKNTIVIITEQTSSYVGTNCVNVLDELKELGYETFTVRQTDTDKTALNFEFLNN